MQHQSIKNKNKTNNKRKFNKSLITLSIMLTISGGLAHAQEEKPAKQKGVFSERIVVTAQKKSQSLQEVGVAVTSFGGEQIESLNWDSSIDIGAQTPGLLITSNSGDAANISLFSIRGVSQTDFAEGQEAPVALYRDSVYISTPGTAGVPIFDIARVEVLKGPQGTLYGRNATGGLVHFISESPTDDFEGYAKLTVADFGQVGFEGALNVPITDDFISRWSVYYNGDDGYIKNRLGSNLRQDDTLSIRGQLYFDISDETSLRLIGNYTDINTTGTGFNTVASKTDSTTGLSVLCKPFDMDCGVYNSNQLADSVNGEVGLLAGGSLFDVANGFIDDGDGDINSGDFDTLGSGVERETYYLTVILEHEFENGISLTSVTDYNEADKFYIEDTDGVPGLLFDYTTSADVQQFSQELHLSGSTDELEWIVGGYYLSYDNLYTGQFQFPADGYSDPTFQVDQSTETLAAFAQVDYKLTDNLTLIGGFRWTQDTIDFTYQFIECEITSPNALGFCPERLISDPTFANDPFSDNINFDGFLVDGITRTFNRKDTEYSGKAQLDYKVNKDLLIYAGYNRGTKGGGFNSSLDGFVEGTKEALGFDPEILNSYETGVKSSFVDDTVRFNASVYFYDYSNFQAFFFAGTTGLLINTEAEFYGADAELTISPGNGWDILAGFSLNQTSVNGEAGGNIIDDQEAPLAPNFTMNGLVRKAWNLSSGAEISVQVSGQYVGDYYFNIINSPAVAAGDYAIFDANVSWISPEGEWEGSVFVNNLTDEEPLSFGFDITGFGNNTIQTYGAPRWVGAKIKYIF